MNLEAILHDLDLERTATNRRLQDLGEAIATVQRLRNGHDAGADVVRAAAAGDLRAQEAVFARVRRRGKRADVDWTRCRQQYENGGVAVARLAQVFKVHVSAIYRQAKAEGWRRPAKADA